MDKLLDDNELLAREPDPVALHHAHTLLSMDQAVGLAELESLADRGSVMALLYIANEWRMKGKKNYSIAEKWYKLAVEKMSVTALVDLALLYCDQSRFDEAEYILKQGASCGDTSSIYWLANIYLSPSRVSEKKGEALALLERANAMGHLRAKHDLAVILLKDVHNITKFIRGLFLYLETVVRTFVVAYKSPTNRRLW